MKHPIYKINNLRVEDEKDTLLNVKSFEIHRGACYVVYGNIGSGKTMLLNFLAKNSKSENDIVFYEEKDINKISKRVYNRDICFVPQVVPQPWFSIKVSDYMKSQVSRYGHIENHKKNIHDITRKMKLGHLTNKNFKSLSLGEQRWVQLAAAIACDTKVLMIDGFGQYMGQEKMSILSKVLYRKVNYDGVTAIVTTHVRERLSKLASVFVQLESGKIIGVRSQNRRPRYNKAKTSNYKKNKK